jgi:predicted RNase H-like nuclease (RuvC/YqgF family)
VEIVVGTTTRCCQERQQASIVPLVQSIKDLAECQRQLAFDHAEERRQEQQVDMLRQEVKTQERQRERCFRRKAELSDLAWKYRKLNAELDPNDENSKRLSDFYVAETNEILEELQQFDNNKSTTIV